MRKFHAFLARRPCLRDALVWSIPAVLVGAALRALLLWYQPHAYWGSDSGSYFWFAQRLLLEGHISLPAKRHFLYPIFLLPVAAIPGPTLVLLAWVQHALGLVTVCALGYCVRKLFRFWKIWLVPVTCSFAILPILIWYEHELIGESLFAHALVWAFAGWLAWDARGRTASSWWFFLAPFAVCILTKSAGRFFWPGIILGLLVTGAWKHLRWPQWVATAALFAVSWTMGESSQGVRLLYTSVFPLTVLDSPLHADLKEEVRDLVLEAKENIPTYHLEDSGPKEFLRTGLKDKERFPAWAALAKEEPELWKRVRELALEAAITSPVQFAGIAGRRTLAAMDLTGFRSVRFLADYFPLRFEEHYDDFIADGELGRRRLALLVGHELASKDFEDLAASLTNPQGAVAGGVVGLTEGIHKFLTPVISPRESGPFPTWLGWWLLLACFLSLAPGQRARLGVWLAVVLGYAFGVHLLGSSNPRFLVPVWSILCVAAALPAEVILSRLESLKNEIWCT